jgi:hypothetical protein
VAIDEVDFSAAATMIEMARLLKERNVRLVLSEIADNVREELDRSEVTGLIGKDAIFETLEDVLAIARHLANRAEMTPGRPTLGIDLLTSHPPQSKDQYKKGTLTP